MVWLDESPVAKGWSKRVLMHEETRQHHGAPARSLQGSSHDGGLGFTWTPKVCRIMAFYGFQAIISPTSGGLGPDEIFPKHKRRVNGFSGGFSAALLFTCILRDTVKKTTESWKVLGEIRIHILKPCHNFLEFALPNCRPRWLSRYKAYACRRKK